jgi:Amt family ammonium transporter
MILQRLFMVMLFCLTPFSTAMAAQGFDSGATAWMMVSTAMVMVMTPAGLALFYGGMSRYKNLLNTFAMTFVSYCLASVIFFLLGYALMFGKGSPFVGWTGFGMVGPVENFAHIPAMGNWLLIWCMLLGRLEIYTVIILLVPEFWRK